MMRLIVALPFVACAGAFVLYDFESERPLAIERQDRKEVVSWWSKIPPKGDVASSVDDTVESIASAFNSALRSTKHELLAQFDDLFAGEQDEDEADIFEALGDDHPHRPHRPRPPRRPHHPGRPDHGHGHRRDLSNLTIYEIISKSEHATKFAKYVDKFDNIVDILNSSKHNVTVFVPIDPHGKKKPKGSNEPDDEFVESALEYLITDGRYPARQLFGTHTLPTLLKEDLLGGEAQRLRVGFSFLGGLRVNFVAKVVAANIVAKNGIIHAIDHVVLPPPFVGRSLTLLPQVFSTLLLAYEKTDFVSFIHGIKTNGTTVFAPSNRAFAKLGPRVNAFLFNTETGLKYLKAILKYHIVANATLYSDALYQNAAGADLNVEDGEDADADGPGRHTHVDLPTLLGDTSVAVDITRWHAFTRIRVNSYIPVTVQDGVAKNGVIHVVGRVLIPPHKHPKQETSAEADGEMDVEELKDRLADYVDGETWETPANLEL